MNFESIYKNRPYLFEIKKDSFEGNEEIIEEIFKKENLSFSNAVVSFVSSNYNYDIYKVVQDKNFYCVKYSFDANNQNKGFQRPFFLRHNKNGYRWDLRSPSNFLTVV